MEIFDSHAHYDDPAFDDDREAVLRSLPEKGVIRIIDAGSSVPSSRTAVRIARDYPFVYAAVGIHPEEANGFQMKDLEAIKELSRFPKVAAIGEIGLDYHFDPGNRQKQIALFKSQLVLAKELNLPVVVHDRDAHGDTLAILQKYRPRGVVHCFSGSAEMARKLLSLGLYLGFTGAITFKNNKKARGVVGTVPHDRILCETDCPYMAPEPLRGRRCDSSMLAHTLARMAEFMGVTPEQAAQLTAKNAAALFGIGLYEPTKRR